MTPTKWPFKAVPSESSVLELLPKCRNPLVLFKLDKYYLAVGKQSSKTLSDSLRVPIYKSKYRSRSIIWSICYSSKFSLRELQTMTNSVVIIVNN